MSRRRYMKSSIALCAALVVISGSASGADANPGSFDRSFSENGRVTAPFNVGSYGQDLYVMNDGRILLIGVKNTGAIALLRFKPNGDPDRSLGDDGQVTVPLGNSERQRVIARGNRIYVGATKYANNEGNWVLMKLNGSGDVVETFGTNGKLVIDEGDDERMRFLVPGADGKFYAMGSSHTGQQQLMVARFNGDGTLDTDSDSDPSSHWANDGVFRTEGEGNPSGLGVHELADGRVLAGGATGLDTITMTRFHPDGSIDETFHSGGTATLDFGTEVDHIERMRFGGGAMYVPANAGTYPDSRTLRVGRFTYDGEPDPNFGENGVKNIDLEGVEYANDAAVDALGRPVIALGHHFPEEDQPSEWIVMRLDLDGTRDGTFGNHGIARSSSWLGASDGPSAIAIQADGRIVAGGTVPSGPESGRMAAARYLSGTCGTIGTSGPDAIAGTAAKDHICGAGEADELSGKGQADRLVGGSGPDTLDGGPGTDVCIGGKGADEFIDCEVSQQ